MTLVHAIGLALVIVLFIGIVVVLCLLAKRGRFYCQRCDSMVEGMADLETGVQEKMMAHFWYVERRVPNRSKIFVCPNCRAVYDDFSLEVKEREQDHYQWSTFCKSCGRRMLSSNIRAPRIWCIHCGVGHEWREGEESGARFLTRMDGNPVEAKGPGWWEYP